jgi:FtsZ-binding cell division protein ZapB
MFGTIGFAPADSGEGDDDDDEENVKKENDGAATRMIPVLILSPYDVPPKPVRDVYWFDLFSKSKRSKSLNKLAYLVYHYGADDPEDCYSFIEQEDFVSYEDGVNQGLNVLDADLEQKVQSGVELTEEEAMRVRGLQELNEDVLKEAADRKRGNDGFKERHEMLAVKKPPAKRQKT